MHALTHMYITHTEKERKIENPNNIISTKKIKKKRKKTTKLLLSQ